MDQVTERSEGWERVPLKVDSGAVDIVIPKSTATGVPLKETVRSKTGAGFKAANGSHIAHYGQRDVVGYKDQYQGVNMKAQVVDVKSALGSVSQMIKAGNRVHFEVGNCYIEHIASGKITPMVKKDGLFEVGIWVRSGGQAVPRTVPHLDFAGQGRS